MINNSDYKKKFYNVKLGWGNDNDHLGVVTRINNFLWLQFVKLVYRQTKWLEVSKVILKS